MAIELYVDSFNKTQTLGITANNLSVAYNIELLKNFNPEASSVFTAGRYFCMVWETSPPSITFADILKNPDVVDTIIYSPEVSETFREKFNAKLEIYNASYESKKYEIKLIKEKRRLLQRCRPHVLSEYVAAWTHRSILNFSTNTNQDGIIFALQH